MGTLRAPRASPWGRLALVSVVVVCLALFGLMARDVVEHARLAFDASALRWLHAHATARRTALALALTRIGEPEYLAGATSLLLLALTAARRWRQAFIFAVEVGGAAVLDLGLKGLFARPRPTLYPHLEPESSFAFPSGHGLVDLAFSLALALLLWRALPGRWRYLGLIGVVFALASGASRPYLQVHYPSDVLAGWVLACAWVLSVHLTLAPATTPRAAVEERDRARGR